MYLYHLIEPFHTLLSEPPPLPPSTDLDTHMPFKSGSRISEGKGRIFKRATVSVPLIFCKYWRGACWHFDLPFSRVKFKATQWGRGLEPDIKYEWLILCALSKVDYFKNVRRREKFQENIKCLHKQAWTNTGWLSYTTDIPETCLGQCYGICEHLSLNHNLSQELTVVVGNENILC